MIIQTDLSQLKFTLRGVVDNFKNNPAYAKSLTTSTIGTTQSKGIQVKLLDDESRNLRICLYEERTLYSAIDGQRRLSEPSFEAKIWIEKNQKKEGLTLIQLRMIDLVEAIVSKHFKENHHSIVIDTKR